MPLEPGQKLSHYRLIEKIGEGGMGVVWKARDEKLRRDVALKVLPAELVQDPERRRRLLSEARSAAAINHPNIGTVYEVDEADAAPTFAALRQRRHRTRRKRGCFVVPVEVTCEMITALVDQGDVDEVNSSDLDCVGKAIAAAARRGLDLT